MNSPDAASKGRDSSSLPVGINCAEIDLPCRSAARPSPRRAGPKIFLPICIVLNRTLYSPWRVRLND
jgi:hypothetical protein